MTTKSASPGTEIDELPKLEPIIKALKCEQTGYIMEAILLYEESIFRLGEMAEEEPSRRQLCGKYLKMYKSRAKQLRDQVKSHLHAIRKLDHVHIERGARGRSYQRLFGPYLDDSVREVHVNEPRLTDHIQFCNLMHFFEVLVKNCRYLKYIRVTTRPDPVDANNQAQILQQMKSDLASGNIQMNFQLDDSLHDRKVVLSSGVVIKIGRGLHYFEPTDSSYSLGMSDFDFRKCLATEVDIWKCRAFAERFNGAAESSVQAEAKEDRNSDRNKAHVNSSD